MEGQKGYDKGQDLSEEERSRLFCLKWIKPRYSCQGLRVHSGDDRLYTFTKHGPLARDEHDNSNLSVRQVLLIAKVFVSCYEHIKPGFFRCL